MHRVPGIAAVQDCWFTAELYGVHYLKGVYAVTNKAVFSMGCRAAMVQAACTGSQALLLVKIVGSQQSFMGCNTSKVNCSHKQSWCKQHANGPKHCCCATVLGYSRAVWGAIPHRFKCSHNQGCFQLELQSCTGASRMHRVPGIAAVQDCWFTAELYGVQYLIGVNAVTNKAVSSMGCSAALVQAACTGS